jgi:hypothetical protein
MPEYCGAYLGEKREDPLPKNQQGTQKGRKQIDRREKLDSIAKA